VRRVQKGFKVLDHTADIGINAYGTDTRELFNNAASGMFSLMVDLNTVEENIEREVELSAEDEDEDEETLLVEWLNELIYIFDVEHVLFKRFEIDILSEDHLKAKCFGEKLEAERHNLKREIKAATYHMLKIAKIDRGYEATVIFDI